MLFKNRQDAAEKLIPYLKRYRKEDGIVLAVPRGGVPIGYHIAKHYNIPLELLLTKKIGHPMSEEFAIGAVSLEDHIVDPEHLLPQAYIDEKIKKIRESLIERHRKFMGDRKAPDLEGKIVIVADDGIATGNTLLAAIRMIRKRKPAKIVIVSPVASIEASEKIKRLVDDFICLYTPASFVGVGLYYQDFSEVSDDEVIRLLRESSHFSDAA
ncbi:MAG: phosphoribosyltransferase [Bacteroidia bacterium]